MGVPSFIRDINLLSEIEPIIKERIKYTVGLVCGHQKSSKFAEYLAWQCGIRPGDLSYVNFRKKLNDSPANDYGIEFIGEVEGQNQTIIKKCQNWTVRIGDKVTSKIQHLIILMT